MTAVITTPWLDPIAPLPGHPKWAPSNRGELTIPPAGSSREHWRRFASTHPRLDNAPPIDPELLNDPMLASFALTENGHLRPVLAYELPTVVKLPALNHGVPLRCPESLSNAPRQDVLNYWRDMCVSVQTPSSRRTEPHGAKPTQMFWTRNAHATHSAQVFIGMEWECEFSSTAKRDNAVRVMWATADAISDVRWAPTEAYHPRRFHVESDGSLGVISHEIVTMPHAVHDPATYEALRHLWSPLHTYANNIHGRCGLHCHVSKSAIRSVNHKNILDFLTCCFLKQVERSHNGLMYYTGRERESTYARALVGDNNGRYRHINWIPRSTVEFRFPGPHGFTEPLWPCYLHDLVMALIDVSHRLAERAAANQVPARYANLVRQALTHQSISIPTMEDAAHALSVLINREPDKYPYAHARFNAPGAPPLP